MEIIIRPALPGLLEKPLKAHAFKVHSPLEGLDISSIGNVQTVR